LPRQKLKTKIFNTSKEVLRRLILSIAKHYQDSYL
jgi:hypothetical protein